MTRRLRCPDCGRRSVVLRQPNAERASYECTLSHPGHYYTPCAWFAFVDDGIEAEWASANRTELARFWAVNPEEDQQPT